MKIFLRIFGLLLFSLQFTAWGAAEVGAERDVVYGEADGQKLLLDVFREVSAPVNRPAVIWVHGGGWGAGSKADYGDGARALARQGYVCFSVDYRLAANGRNHWPAQLDDVQRAVRWVRAHADQYGIDPKRIGAIGHSAGGHLVACLGTRETRHNSDASLAAYSSRVSCVVDMSGPADLVNRENPLGDGMVRNLLGGTTAELPEAGRDASPINFVDAQSAPFLLIHGRADELVPPQQAERMDAALRAAGIESKLLIFEGEGHVLTRQENSDRMVRETLGFLKRHLMP